LSNKSPDNSLVVIVGTTSDGNNIKKSNSKEVCKVERKFVREKEVTSENTSFNDNSKTLEKEREVVKSNDTVISPHKTSNNEPHCKSTNDSLVIVVGTNSDERIIKKSSSKMKNSSENILANDDSKKIGKEKVILKSIDTDLSSNENSDNVLSNKMSNKEFKYKPHENSVIAMVRTDSGKHNSNKSSLNNVYITEEKSVENAVNVMVETDSCESSVNKSNSKKKCIAYENFDGEKEATSENIPICDISKSTNEKAMAKTIDIVLLSNITSSNKTRDNSIENAIDVMIKNGSNERYIRETNAKKANREEEKSTSEKEVTSACNLANDDSKKVNKEKKNAKGSVSDLWFNKTFDNEPALKPLDNSIDVVGRTDSSENNIKKSNSQNIGVKKNKSTRVKEITSDSIFPTESLNNYPLLKPINKSVVIINRSDSLENKIEIEKSNLKKVIISKQKFAKEQEVTLEIPFINNKSNTPENMLRNNIDTALSSNKTSNNEPQYKLTKNSIVVMDRTAYSRNNINKSNPEKECLQERNSENIKKATAKKFDATMSSNKPPNNGVDKSAARAIDRADSYNNIIKKSNPKEVHLAKKSV